MEVGAAPELLMCLLLCVLLAPSHGTKAAHWAIEGTAQHKGWKTVMPSQRQGRMVNTHGSVKTAAAAAAAPIKHYMHAAVAHFIHSTCSKWLSV